MKKGRLTTITACLVLIAGMIYIGTLDKGILCTIKGGDLTPVPFLDEYICIYKYSDGGKKCSSSKECKGVCLLDKADDVYGHCASRTLGPVGCDMEIESRMMICRGG